MPGRTCLGAVQACCVGASAKHVPETLFILQTCLKGNKDSPQTRIDTYVALNVVRFRSSTASAKSAEAYWSLLSFSFSRAAMICNLGILFTS